MLVSQLSCRSLRKVRISVVVTLSYFLCLNVVQGLQEDPVAFFDDTDIDAYSKWLGSTANSKYTNAVFLPSSSDPVNGAAFHWSIDEDSQKIYIGVAARATGWVGIGLSENGGMAGSDIVLYTAKDDVLTDSYATAIGPPRTDNCQHWELLSSQSDGGFLIFEATRDLETEDSQDWPIVKDAGFDVPAQRVIAAWGDTDTVQYHGPDHVAKGAVRFYGDGDEERQFYAAMAVEAEGQLNLRAVDYAVLTNETDYAYFCFNVSDLQGQNVPLEKDLHVIGFEPVVDSDTAKYVHHFILAAATTSQVGDCWDANWDELAYVWAPGDGPLELPKDVGTPLGQNGFLSFLLEIHYNNPMGDEGAIDSSGVRLYYTSQTREHDLGIISLGDPRVGLNGEVVGRDLTQHDFSCPSSCTSKKMTNDITVVREYLHMHMAGLRMTNHQIRGGEVIHTGVVNFFDFDQSGAIAPRQDAFVIKPGDEFRTTCYFSDPSGNKTFGLGSSNEMCIAFLFYYPRVSSSFSCVIADDEEDEEDDNSFEDCTEAYIFHELADIQNVGQKFGLASETCSGSTYKGDPQASEASAVSDASHDEQSLDGESLDNEQTVDDLEDIMVGIKSVAFSLSASGLSFITCFTFAMFW